MADRAGARSQLAQLVFAGIVLLVLLALTGPLEYLPRCRLAAVVFTIAVGMIDATGLRDIRRESPGEFYLAVSTAAVVVTNRPPKRWRRALTVRWERPMSSSGRRSCRHAGIS